MDTTASLQVAKDAKKFQADEDRANLVLDGNAALSIRNSGWRCCTIWEGSPNGRTRRPLDKTIERVVVGMAHPNAPLRRRATVILSNLS